MQIHVYSIYYTYIYICKGDGSIYPPVYTHVYIYIIHICVFARLYMCMYTTVTPLSQDFSTYFMISIAR